MILDDLANQSTLHHNRFAYNNPMMFATEQQQYEQFEEEDDSVMDPNAPVDPLSGLNTILLTWLYNSNSIDQFWHDLEARTGHRRETVRFLIRLNH